MSLKIVFPADESKVGPTFLAHGYYEYPDDVRAVLVRLTPKIAAAFPEKRPMPHQQWGFMFRHVPPGPYALIVADVGRLAFQSVDIVVRQTSRPVFGVKLSISCPLAGTDPSPHTLVADTGFPAQGYAINGNTIAGQMIANNGAGPKIADGTPVESPSKANDWFWQLSFGALADQTNCQFSAQSGGATQSNNFIDIGPPPMKKEKTRKKKKGKK
jgi:hypothetical protein